MYFGDHKLIQTGTRDCQTRDCEKIVVVFSFINVELIISSK